MLLLVAAIGGAACAKPARPVADTKPIHPDDEVPTCEAAAAHVVKLMLDSDDMKAATPLERDQATSVLEDDVGPEIVLACVTNKWDARTRSCLLAASRADDLQSCSVDW